jgi:hypothetical protein
MKRRALAALLLLALAIFVPALASSEQPSITGPVLTADLPKDAVLVGNDEDENGYTERLATSDGLANIILLRRDGSATADDILKELYPDAADVQTDNQALVGSYPAVRETFSLGANEDARVGVIVVFSTDTDTFAFAADAALDAYEGDEDYKGSFDIWIESLDVFDDIADVAGAVQPTGLTLSCALPEDAQPYDGKILENGDYTQPYLVGDGMAAVILARRDAATDAEAFLKDLYPEATDAKAISQQPVASYPAERLTFTNGENEDTRQGVLVAFSTDSGSFAFVAEISADSYDDYKDTVEAWISSLDLIDG